MAAKNTKAKQEAAADVEKVGDYTVVELREFLLNGGVIPPGIDYHPYGNPQFVVAGAADEEDEAPDETEAPTEMPTPGSGGSQ